MHTMTDAQSVKFIAALDKVDAALTAIRHEFEELARQSAERLAALNARDAGVSVRNATDRLSAASDHREAATA